MLYMDDDARHAFHQTPALLQIMCTTLEAFLAEAAIQLRVIDTDKHLGMFMVMCDAADVSDEVLQGCVDRLNKLFVRKDESDTCVIEDLESKLLTVRATDSTDLVHLH